MLLIRFGFASFFTDKISKLRLSLVNNSTSVSPHSPSPSNSLPDFSLSILQLNLKYLRSYPAVPTSNLTLIPYQLASFRSPQLTSFIITTHHPLLLYYFILASKHFFSVNPSLQCLHRPLVPHGLISRITGLFIFFSTLNGVFLLFQFFLFRVRVRVRVSIVSIVSIFCYFYASTQRTVARGILFLSCSSVRACIRVCVQEHCHLLTQYLA